MTRLALTALALALGVQLPAAHAGWSVSVGLHAPIYCRPYCGPYYYYRPYPLYVRPAVYVEPSVAVVQPAPVYTVVPAAAPAAPALTPVIARAQAGQDDLGRYQQQLQSLEPRERAEAVTQLGRLRAPGSLESLTAALNNDRSPLVREAAARGLGLLGSDAALTALQRAASTDDNGEVRHSAAYAADVIRAHFQQQH